MSAPAQVYVVTYKALASAIKVLAPADDSRGVIGDAERRLVYLHPAGCGCRRARWSTG